MINTCRGWGGAEEQILLLTRELRRRGHDVAVIARAGGPVEREFLRADFPVLPVVRKGAGAFLAPLISAVRVRKLSPDILHSHRDHDLPLAKLLSRAAGAPLLLTQRCMPKNPNALVYGFADRIVTVSHYIAGGIRERVPSVAGRVSVIHSGIDPAMFASPDREYWRRRPDVGDRTPLIGSVGAFYKGQEELVSMMPRLKAEFPRIALLLIGEDAERKQTLVDLAERLGVADAVVFAGLVPRERMKDALGGLDLNVSAFRNEGLGLTVIEGLAAGTPFAGYRAGGYPETVRERADGVLADGPADLAEAVAALLRERESLREERRPRILEGFTLPEMADAYERVYRDMAGAA
jgi:glycosyltransferase involved in cell wall biosynthesis